MTDQWMVPSGQQRTRHDDGQWLVYDYDRAACWQVTQGVAEVLESLAEGWQPGAPLPPRLRPFDLTPADAAALVADLAQQGLVINASAPRLEERQPRRFRFMWSLWRAPAMAPGVWRVIVMTLAAAALAAAAILWNQLPAVPDESRFAFLARVLREALQRPPASRSAFVETLFYWVLLATVHEHAHAFALTSRTGKPATIGFRLIAGLLPRPFADVTALVTLRRKRDRIPVLVAGPLAEFATWLVVLVALGTHASRLGLPFVLLGPAILLVNLVPFFRNDGYLVLQELTGDRDLIHSAHRAAHRAFLAPDPQADSAGHWWLPWYGLIELACAPALLVPVGILLGGLASSPSAGAVCGVAAALIVLTRRVHAIDVTAEEWPDTHAA